MATKLRRSNFHTDADNHVNESINAKLAANLGNISTGNITTTGYIAGPATFTIDPAAVGDNTGTLIVAGNLQVDGTTTTINSTTLEVDDLNITLASGAANAAAANGAGITVDGASATITYASASDSWSFNKNVGIGTSSPGRQLHVKSSNATVMQVESTNASIAQMTFVSDGAASNPAIGAVDDTAFNIQTGNTERMRITSAGKVGIGTSSPSDKLSLEVGSANEGLSIYYSGVEVGSFRSDAGNATINANNASLKLATGGTERMRITSGGSLLVGTTSGVISGTTYGLEVKNALPAVFMADATFTSLTYGGVNFYRPANAAGNGNGISFSLNNSSSAYAEYGYIGAVIEDNTAAAQDGSLLFATSVNGTRTEHMRIKSSGNVGIGTNSPTQRLSVKGTNSTTGQSGADVTMDVYDDSTGGIDVGGAIGFRGNDGINSNVMFGEVSGRKENATSGNYASYMGFKTRADSGSLTERLRIDSKGAMILGDTAEPSGAGGNGAQFFLKQGSSSNGIASVANGNDAYIRMQHNGTLGQISTTYGTSAGYTPLSFATSGSERLQITTDGNILCTKAFIIPNAGQTTGFYGSGEGIGIYNQNAYSSCGAHMEIATNASDGWASFYINRTWSSGGDERTFDFRINGSTVGLINTTSSGTTYTTTSDIRLKTDIQPITDATDKLMAMKPVSHKWKADPDADAVHGFIAQEMQQIIPEAVSGDPDGETMMQMDYGRITPVLVAALQNALKEIDMLKNRITELEAK